MWQLLNNLHTVIRHRNHCQRSSASPAVKCSLFPGILKDLCIYRQLCVEDEKHLISYFAPVSIERALICWLPSCSQMKNGCYLFKHIMQHDVYQQVLTQWSNLTVGEIHQYLCVSHRIKSKVYLYNLLQFDEGK